MKKNTYDNLIGEDRIITCFGTFIDPTENKSDYLITYDGSILEVWIQKEGKMEKISNSFKTILDAFCYIGMVCHGLCQYIRKEIG